MKQVVATASLALAVIPCGAFAGDLTEAKAPTRALASSAISGDIGLSVLNQYIARGLVLEDRGVVFQPYADIYIRLYEGNGFIERFSLQAGIWNDLNSSGPIAAPNTTTKAWTELLWQAGFTVKFARRFSLSTAYRQFTSPSDAYLSGRAINSVLSFDDSGLLDGNFCLKPQLTVLYELPASGQNGLRGHSWYFAPGITPSYTLFADSKMPVTLGLPISAGLGSSFYAGKTFGYLAAGPQLTVPLAFVPNEYGTWTFSAGYSFYYLGRTSRAFAPDQRNGQNLFNASLELKF